MKKSHYLLRAVLGAAALGLCPSAGLAFDGPVQTPDVTFRCVSADPHYTVALSGFYDLPDPVNTHHMSSVTVDIDLQNQGRTLLHGHFQTDAVVGRDYTVDLSFDGFSLGQGTSTTFATNGRDDIQLIDSQGRLSGNVAIECKGTVPGGLE